MKQYYLSADGGGTKTAFLLTDEDGNKAASVTLGPANYIVNGLDEVIVVLREGINTCVKQAKIDESQINGCFFAIAGFKDIPDDIEPVTKTITEAFSNLNIQLGNDTENALAGSLLGQSGIHIIAGTGSIGLGFDQNQKYIRSGGWHHLFGGDEGSGYWIGCQLLQHFTKQADGREPKTQLHDYLIDKYDLGSAENILDLVINKWDGKRENIASLSQDVADLAKQGDPIAQRIFVEAAKELALIVDAIYKQGHFNEPLSISYSGGVFKSLDFMIDQLTDSLTGIRHEWVSPILQPLPGGIILAMQLAKHPVSETIIQNLKNN